MAQFKRPWPQCVPPAPPVMIPLLPPGPLFAYHAPFAFCHPTPHTFFAPAVHQSTTHPPGTNAPLPTTQPAHHPALCNAAAPPAHSPSTLSPPTHATPPVATLITPAPHTLLTASPPQPPPHNLPPISPHTFCTRPHPATLPPCTAPSSPLSSSPSFSPAFCSRTRTGGGSE